MPDKDIKHKRYIESINAVIYAEGKLKGTCPEIQAYLIDQTFELGGYDKDYFLNDIGIGRERSVYGIRLQDTGSGLNIERAGAHIGLPNSILTDDMLPVQNKMKRCLVSDDGVIGYYLDDDNSMWKEGSAKVQSTDLADGQIIASTDDYAAGTYEIEVDGVVEATNIGKVINIFDGVAHNFWYAVIIAADELAGTYTLSHPHIEGFGAVGVGETAYYMIGDAKLNGADGNVMTYLPTHWERARYYPDAEQDDRVARIWRGWHETLISLRPFEGASLYPHRFYSCFEGVSANAAGEAYDGWTGTLDATDPANYKWTSPTTTASPNRIMSVAGFYPRTSFTVTQFRTACENNGEGYHQLDFASTLIVNRFIIIEYASMDTQSSIAYGIANLDSTNWSSYNGRYTMRKGGDTIQAGNKTWDMTTLAMKVNMVNATEAQRTIRSFSYRGIENLYGHVFKWVDGHSFIQRNPAGEDSYHESWVTMAAYGGVADYKNYKSHADGAAAAADDNYTRLKDLKGEPLEVINVTRYWKMPSLELMPNDSKASSTAYCADYFYAASESDGTTRVFALGGAAHDAGYAGAFYVYSNLGFGNARTICGGRLCRIGND